MLRTVAVYGAVAARRRDVLQEAIELVKQADYPLALQFVNFRD